MGEPAAVELPALREGVLVADKYRLVAPKGEGAMGSVWSAIHVTLGSQVAIKFLHGSIASSSEPRARFEREAKLAARLGEASRHITRVMDHGVTSEGTPFLVMELLKGEGLDARLKRERRLPMALIAKITSHLCRALNVAHGAGVVHRDLKPANVFLCDSQDESDVFVKLLDFGVAKATLENEENQTTRAGALIGTPNYMSPEQIVGDSAVDSRSDLWAVAAIVYRMAVGKAPFGSGALSELAMRIISTEPAQPTSLAPDLPTEFDLWARKGLAKKADQRFQTARDLSDSLAMVAGISSSGSTGSFSAAAAERLALQIGDSVGGLQHTLHEQNLAPTIAAPPPKPKRSFAPFIAIGLLAGLGGGIGLYLVRASHNETPVPPPAAAAKTASTETVKATATPTATTTASAPATTVTAATETSTSATAKVAVPVNVKKIPTKSTTTKEPGDTTPTAAPPPPPPPTTAAPDINKKSGDLWKKKDEM
jgi:serine/threonine protein kinase